LRVYLLILADDVYGDCLEVKREYYLNCFILATCCLFNGHS